MNTNLQPIQRERRPRVAKGLLVSSTHPARYICTKHFDTIYVFRPFSYKIVRKDIVDKPIKI